jgi:dTDP-4-amino-4,6-dideoxygalactose transaminase
MIPFSPPRIDQRVIDEVVDSLKSGWITTGPKTKLFEQKLTEYCGCKKTLCLNSATAGLEIILRWFGVKEGDEVILPAYTYCATANVVIHCGAKPVMVDINAKDFNIDLRKIKEAITEKTKVVMPVDIGGYPTETDEILELVSHPEIVSKFRAENDIQQKLGRILVLTDAAHSLGAIYKGRKVGSWSDITVFSFHAVKNLTTAEGGAIAFNLPQPFDCDEIYKYLCVKTLHGQNKDALSKMQKGAWRYDIIEPGYKMNMTDILSAIGLVELSRYDNDTLVRRKEIFEFYLKKLSNYKWAELPICQTNDKISSYHVFLLRIKNITEAERDEIIKRIFDKDVSVNVHFQPLPLFTAYKNLGYKINNYPVSYDNYSREISLPVFYDLTNEQLEYVCNAVINSVNEVLNS